MVPTPPTSYAVVDMMRERCPGVSWPLGTVALLLADFPDRDHLAAASAAADWITRLSSGKVKDGPTVLRRFLEKAPRVGGENPPPDLSAYDRFEN